MNKMKKYLPLGISLLVFPLLLGVSGPWYGDPDPFACNVYDDCMWTTPVCINNGNYTVGIYADPAGMADNQIESLALFWTDTILTAGACPESTPLINMYVYYSEVPFFGETNTITIISAMGIPSEERVKYWAGGAFPEGFDYQKGPACTGVLYDNGTDKGYFTCDGFLDSVFERRGWLRNDPEGPAFDLEPKIEKYLKELKELGDTPILP